MDTFDLINISHYEAQFPSMPLSQLRAIVDDAVREMKWEFDGREDEIDDWAAGGWNGRSKLMNAYALWKDHPEGKIRRLAAFETLIEAFALRERKELEAALAHKHAA